MSTSTKLRTKVAHLNDTNLITVLLPKECHSSSILCLFQSHLLSHNIQTCRNLVIYDFLDLCDLLRCHCGEMREVKTKSLCIHIRTLLLDMIAKHLTKCFLQKMGCTVVLAGIQTVLWTYL